MSEIPRLGDAPHYQTVRTLLVDYDEGGRQIAWIEGAIWLPEGSAIDLYEPARDATVVGTRLCLDPRDGSAMVLVLVRFLEADTFLPKDAGA